MSTDESAPVPPEASAEGGTGDGASAGVGAGAGAGAGVPTAATPGGIAAAGCSPAKCPKVAFGGAYRAHCLLPTDTNPDPTCDCGRIHVTYGKTYRYCACGLSKDQPFCDDTCVGNARVANFPPMEFTVDKRQSTYLFCGCKRTQRPPICDGSHIHIDWASLEW